MILACEIGSMAFVQDDRGLQITLFTSEYLPGPLVMSLKRGGLRFRSRITRPRPPGVPLISSAPEPRRRSKPGDGLTPREVEVLREIASGRSDREIGLVLGVTRSVVKFHVKNLLRKLSVDNRAAAAVHGVRSGLV